MFFPSLVTKGRVCLGERAVRHNFLLASGWIRVLVRRERAARVPFGVRAMGLQVNERSSYLKLVVYRWECFFSVAIRRFQHARLRNDRIRNCVLRRPSSSQLRRSPPILGKTTSRDVEQGNESHVVRILGFSYVRHGLLRHAVDYTKEGHGPISKAGRVVNERLGTYCGARCKVLRRRRRGDYQDAWSNGRTNQELVRSGDGGCGSSSGRRGCLRRLGRSLRQTILRQLLSVMGIRCRRRGPVGYRRREGSSMGNADFLKGGRWVLTAGGDR